MRKALFSLLAVVLSVQSEAELLAQMRPVSTRKAMVVSAQKLASEAGVAMLRKGGNAIDAAVATELALAVVHPVAGNLGGGGFMLIRLANGEVYALDYREKAPLKATRTMYLDSLGNPSLDRSKIGHLAVGVPGTVAGIIEAHRRFGRLPFKTVIQPAIELAEKGYPLTRYKAEMLNRFAPLFARYAGSRKYFTKGDTSQKWQEGDLFVQKDLAETLKRIRDKGRDGFYKGKTAELIIAEMKRGGGLITQEDLDKYEAKWREPIKGSYRGYEIYSMPPPSAGGIGLVQLLSLVEPYNLKEMGFQSSETIHLFAEAMRRVYADRLLLGDPDFVKMPVQELLSKAYLKERWKSFSPDTVTPSTMISSGKPLAIESMETTHYSVVDAEGNAVATTTTLNGAFGSFVAVEGAGFLLNNEMDDFSLKPGMQNPGLLGYAGLMGSEANAIMPEKRMLSSMSPTILTKNGKLFMVIGTPGGATIITQVFQVITNVIDFGMNIQEAVSAKRIHHQWLPDELRYEKDALRKDVIRALERRGWKLRELPSYYGAADGILVGDDGWLYGGADPRNEDAAVGF
ncbi:MAG: gamma-glutamyltransferase [Chloroherpetonaceae bacterium]|nr:gamma-glutamyltransferase [Chloroherpetonaceae bacterium]MDW8019793.1 gamma-glutamyltransferase [Chloroherpetonaceae bacterium]